MSWFINHASSKGTFLYGPPIAISTSYTLIPNGIKTQLSLVLAHSNTYSCDETTHREISYMGPCYHRYQCSLSIATWRHHNNNRHSITLEFKVHTLHEHDVYIRRGAPMHEVNRLQMITCNYLVAH